MSTSTQWLIGGLVLLGILAVLVAPRIFAAQDPEPAGPRPPTITLAEFDRMRTQTNCVVLDVRTTREFAAGHVPGAVHVDWSSGDFTDKIGALDKQKTYLVHCASGFRSARAVGKMHRLGFKDLYDFSGGWNEWSRAGKPVEK
jgi:rhodanese-related sulfurtransferase